MSGFARAAGALLGAIVLAGFAVAVADWAREVGYLPQPAEGIAAAASNAVVEPISTGRTPYDLFIGGDYQSAVQLDEINALCGFSGPIGPDETRLAIVGEAPGALLIHSTSDGELPAIALRSAPADQLHAYARYGELAIMLASGQFDVRVFPLDENAEPVNGDRLENDSEWSAACGDAPAAAAALNAAFAEQGARFDPVQETLDQFADGSRSPIGTACGVSDIRTAVSGRWIIGSSVRREQPWDGVFHPENRRLDQGRSGLPRAGDKPALGRWRNDFALYHPPVRAGRIRADGQRLWSDLQLGRYRRAPFPDLGGWKPGSQRAWRSGAAHRYPLSRHRCRRGGS